MKVETKIGLKLITAVISKLYHKELVRSLTIFIGSFILSTCIPLVAGIDSLFIISIMFTLLVHELGHYFAMKYFKYKNIKIIFFFIVAITKTTDMIKSRFERIIISLAGPVPGILLGSVMYLFANYLPDQLISIADYLIFINTINLIPVAILDGGNIFESLFISNSNKTIGIFNLITGAGSFILCFVNRDYFILCLCTVIMIRGIIFFRHKKKPPIIELIDDIKLKHKLMLTGIWGVSIVIAMLSMFL